MKQFKIPITKILKEISLDGEDTSKQCIQSIHDLQGSVDIIMIIRGGGDTSGISNSFDTIELFDAIYSSKIPIITAIGHEADTGDKLLITNVSDYDFPTPSTAAIEITKILLNPIIDKIESQLCEIKSQIIKNLNSEYEKSYNLLEYLFIQYKKDKFEGQIIKIENDTDFILIENNGNIYKIMIHFNEKMDYDVNEVNKYDKLILACKKRDIETIIKLFNDITESNTLDDKISNYIEEIKKIDKYEKNFKNLKPQKVKSLYCKNQDITDVNINKLISLNRMFLWYKTSLIELNEDFEEIYDYLNV